jgi:hypothetical protein
MRWVFSAVQGRAGKRALILNPAVEANWQLEIRIETGRSAGSATAAAYCMHMR